MQRADSRTISVLIAQIGKTCHSSDACKGLETNPSAIPAPGFFNVARDKLSSFTLIPNAATDPVHRDGGMN